MNLKQENDFAEFIFRKTPELDNCILENIRKESELTIKVTTPCWFDVRELVRKISEGITYKPSNKLFPATQICTIVKPVFVENWKPFNL